MSNIAYEITQNLFQKYLEKQDIKRCLDCCRMLSQIAEETRDLEAFIRVKDCWEVLLNSQPPEEEDQWRALMNAILDYPSIEEKIKKAQRFQNVAEVYK